MFPPSWICLLLLELAVEVSLVNIRDSVEKYTILKALDVFFQLSLQIS